MAQLNKFQMYNPQLDRMQLQKAMADPAAAYQTQPGVAVPFQDNYMLKGQQLPPSLHGMGGDPKMAAPSTSANLMNDRAQYKQTLGKFLSSSGGTKKSGDSNKVRPGEGKKATGSDETDSGEDEMYTKKKGIAGARDEDKDKVQKKFKIFDDNECEGAEGSDDDDEDEDDSGEDDEEYEDEVDDDSDQDDDLMSSADDNNSAGGGQKDSKKSTDQKQGEIVEKASF